jgi:hypothetical protein
MQNEAGNDVRVVVSGCALMAIDLPCDSGVRKLDGEYRSRIEKVASDKYDEGSIGQDGPVPITRADIEG